MSDDKYSHLGLALVAVMVALGTFAAGFFNGQSVSAAGQTAAVINATAANGATASITFRPEEIRALRELLAKFNANRPAEAAKDGVMTKPAPAAANACVQGIRAKYESQKKTLMEQVRTLDQQIKAEVVTQCGAPAAATLTSEAVTPAATVSNAATVQSS